LNFKSILAIGAHPDDIEFGCFGFLLKQQKLGSNIYGFIASPDSEEKDFFDKRVKETKESFNLINNSSLIIRNKNKINIEDYVETADMIRDIVIKNKIDLVLVHSYSDTHQEHRMIHEITMSSLRRLPVTIFGYRSPSTEKFNPNLIIDINQEYNLKIEAIKKHISQLDKTYFSEDSIKISNQSWNAKKVGIDFCEEFDILRMIDKG
jgi:LmbE family N-acetylglucosaminyl deacetylase